MASGWCSSTAASSVSSSPPAPAGQVLGHRRERGIDPDVSGAPGSACPHPRGGRDSCVAQDTRVVVKHLNEDVAPEPAQPLALLEHGDGAAGGPVNRLKRLHLHTSNGSDRMRR